MPPTAAGSQRQEDGSSHAAAASAIVRRLTALAVVVVAGVAAAVGSSRNFGVGSSALGRSPAKIGTRCGASGSSQSMLRSKNVRSIPRLCRTVWALRQNYHFGPGKIAMYLARYHDVSISSSGVWRILKRLDVNRLPASQRYKRLDCRCQRYEKQV
jgi:hypothetical protein